MGSKAAEATWNISNASGPGTANKHTVQWWFKKFSKGDESLEDEEWRGQPSEVDNDQLRAWLKLIPLQQHKKLLKNSTSTILQSFSIWSKLERWKSLVSRCLMTWLKMKKVINLKSPFLILHNNNKPFLDWIVICDENGFYTATSDDQLSGWT